LVPLLERLPMAEVTVKAKTVSELRTKLAAMRVLFKDVKIYATGYFRSDKNDLIFFDTMKAEVQEVGRKYVVGQVDGETMRYKPDPVERSIWDTEFLVHGQEASNA
jgi:hypothetical protein